MNRRQFFQVAATMTGASLLLQLPFTAANAEQKRKGSTGKNDLVDLNDGTAKAVGYIHDTKTPGKTCSGCSLYKKVEMRDGKEVGSCPLFGGKMVYGNGYCNSWAKR